MVVGRRLGRNDADMSRIPAAAVEAAAARLRGHVVLTPLIGSVLLGGDTRIDLRWKADMLQPGGSGWFRGYLHLLLRSYGALPGLVFAQPTERLLAAAIAAQQHRLPFVAFVGVPVATELQAAVVQVGGSVEVVADPDAAAAQLQRAKGYLPLPGAEHPEVAAGLATAGLELGLGLPADCTTVYAPGSVADSVAAGLAASGRARSVISVGHEAPIAAVGQLCAAVAMAHRLHLSPAGGAVLVAALRHAVGEPVGALVIA